MFIVRLPADPGSNEYRDVEIDATDWQETPSGSLMFFRTVEAPDVRPRRGIDPYAAVSARPRTEQQHLVTYAQGYWLSMQPKNTTEKETA